MNGSHLATRWPPYPRDLLFASHFVYPRPFNAKNTAEQNLKAFLLGIKADAYRGQPPRRLITTAIERIAGHLAGSNCPYATWFGPDVVLVPMPGHGKMLPKAVSTGRLLCLEMERLGLGRMIACIERTDAVQKSATAAPGGRPSFQRHYDTMWVDGNLTAQAATTSVVLVDDIVTRGATLLGAAGRIAQAFPQAQIRSFAIARTAQYANRAEDPVAGIMSQRWGNDTERRP